jgi:hypothetical protein
MKSKILGLCIISAIILVSLFGCDVPSSKVAGDVSVVRYYYDSTHDVGIWTIGEGGYGTAIAVLPGNQIKNKEIVGSK